MASLTESDIQFIERLQNVAGTSNQDVLSDQDILRGRVLLSNAQDQLRSLSKHVHILQVTLAPHRKLPKDILLRIFKFLSPIAVEEDEMPLPPVTSEVPWTLGQVCRAWRQLSRSIPELWSPLSVFVYTAKDVITVRHVLNILPDIVQVSVQVRSKLRLDHVKNLLIPLLLRVDNLIWDPQAFSDHFWTIFPPRAFARFKSLDLSHSIPEGDNSVITSDAELFGRTSRLEHLKLDSNTPAFLCCDLPWVQVKSLTLKNTDSSCMWPTLVKVNLFSPESRLETLVLDFESGVLPLILRIDFPWHTIVSFSVACYKREDYLALSEVTPKCIALVDFKLGIINEEPDHSITVVKQLKSLSLWGRINSCVTRLSALWNGLQELEIQEDYPVSIQMFYEIVRQCDCLVKLSLPVYTTLAGSPGNMPIELSRLRFLHLKFRNTDAFSLITTPALDVFEIAPRRRVNYKNIGNFLKRSNCKVVNFSSKYTDAMQFDFKPFGIQELLSSLSHCTTFEVPYTPLPISVLDEIATGALLPCVQKIHICTRYGYMFFNMVERRLKMESTQSGHLQLQEITCWACSKHPRKDDLRKLESIQMTYGQNLRSLELQYHDDDSSG
ncbi:hypothetical protein C0995_006973 [Termitomyces sp. Mi166|nr:hypothetical protein C0995_006973 [Termitomyces sp. Mi166\